MRWRVAIGAAVVIAVIAALALRGGGDHKARTGTSTTQTTAKQAPKPRHGRPKRHDLHRGHGARPDEPAPGTGPLLGIADQKPETFADPLFRKIGVRRTRLNTPWNSIFTEPQRLDGWLQAVRQSGIEPLVAFERARGSACPAAPCSLPRLADYRRAVAAFHARYPWVRLLQPWNEANSSTQPTAHHPERAARFYEAVKSICPGCIVPAADVLDGSNITSWLTRFKSALRGHVPSLWGIHNYSDINRFRSSGTQRLLQLMPGEIWMTEAGGIVSFSTADGRTPLPYDEHRAARATAYLFQLARMSPRIKRVYIYQWKIDFPGNRFDAGLVGLTGKPRPALQVVLDHRSLIR